MIYACGLLNRVSSKLIRPLIDASIPSDIISSFQDDEYPEKLNRFESPFAIKRIALPIVSYETRTNSNLIATIYNDQCQRLGEICVRNGEIVYVSVDISGDLKRVSESEELVFKSYVEGKVWKADEIKPIDKLPKT